MLTPNPNPELQPLPKPYVPGPYTYVQHSPPASVPSLVSFALRALLSVPDQIRLPVRLPLRSPRLLDELIADPACLDPRLWATLVQIYDGLPKYLHRIELPHSDEHMRLLQSVASTPRFSLITILSLPACGHLTDNTILQFKFLHSLTAFDASATSLSPYAIRSLAACLQVQSADSTDTERRHRGPWHLRVLSLRDCKKMSTEVLSSFLAFPLLSAIDLRGTPCRPHKSYPFKPCPLPSHSLLHPATLSQSLQSLLNLQPHLYSSPHPFFIHINTLHYKPSTKHPPRPSVAPQDAFVTVPPSSKAPIKISSAILIEKQIQQREDAIAHERNKDAWYERQDRLDYDIIHTRKIRPSSGSTVPAFKSSSSSKPFASLKHRLNKPPSFTSRNQNTMGPVPKSSFPPQNRNKPLPQADPNKTTNTGRHATTINTNTSPNNLAHPHLIPAPRSQNPTHAHPRSTFLNPQGPTLAPALSLTDKDKDHTQASRPKSSVASAAEIQAAYHSLSVPKPEPTSASDHAVSTYHHHHGFPSESQPDVRHHPERRVTGDREGNGEGSRQRGIPSSGQTIQTRGLPSELTPIIPSSAATFRLINDLPNPDARSSGMNDGISNTTHGRTHFPAVTGNQEYPPVVREPRASVICRRDGEAAADEDEVDDSIPAQSRTHGTLQYQHQHQHQGQPSFSRPSQPSSKTRDPSPRPSSGPSASASGPRLVPHPDAFNSDNEDEYEHEHESYLRLYRPPPPWSALEHALNIRHKEEAEREQRISGYPVPLPLTASSSSSSSGAVAGGRGRGAGKGKDGSEMAKVDMTSERAARVKRELDAVVQAAAKRRRLDMIKHAILPVAADEDIHGHSLARPASAEAPGSRNDAQRQSQPSPLPLVNESTSRNPFRRKPHLASGGSTKHGMPPMLSLSLAKPPIASASASTRVKNGGEYEDEIMDDEDEYDKTDNDNDNDNNDHEDPQKDANSTSILARSMSAVAVVDGPSSSSSMNHGKIKAKAKGAEQSMTPISSVKVPVLPSQIRDQALARERKESGSGSGFRPGSSASVKTKGKQGQGSGSGSGQAKFDWKSWGGGGSASSSR